MLALALVAITLFLVDRTLTTYATRQQSAIVDSRLAIELRILSADLDQVPDEAIASWAHSAASRAQARVTVTGEGDQVLADAPGSLPPSENQVTVHTPVLRRDKPPLTLQLRAPVATRSDQATTDLRARVLEFSLGSALLALGIAYLVSRSLSQRVSRLKQAAEDLVGHAPGTRTPRIRRRTWLAGTISHQRRRGVARHGEPAPFRNQARLEAILSGMAEGVLAVDHDLRITFCNGAFLRAIGFRGRSFEGLTLLELVRDPGLHQLLRDVLLTGDSRMLRFKLSAANARSFEVQATPVDMPSGRGAIAIFHDTAD